MKMEENSGSNDMLRFFSDMSNQGRPVVQGSILYLLS